MYERPTPNQASALIQKVVDEDLQQKVIDDYVVGIHQSVGGVEFWAIHNVANEEEKTFWMKPFAGLNDEDK